MEFPTFKHLSINQWQLKPNYSVCSQDVCKKHWFSFLGGRVLRPGLDDHCFTSSQRIELFCWGWWSESE